ncbi:30S ribosomal protein S4 [Candidatus Nanohalobium constans]|uniref:30S ribosomal protein S4 n=1 Tax=Candidatus Nanohalobium constans TaxID=2565781 RepID=A0A5Q0UJ14_9ARCH|nr:30S ribosomal protein S4 [Candidatus Nanohalobium constans]QGA80945.1 30S ribosomal protein S4 [Candidatus Nanohalobium constans]
MVKKLKKQYETPNEGWNEERMDREEELMEDYGLKNKKEIYKAQSQLRSFRRQARKLVAEEDEEAKQEVIDRVNNLGLIRENAGLEALLTLKVTDILDRRIQSAVERKGYADTPKHARQLVVHGHIYIDGERVNTPGYLLTQEEEQLLEERIPETPDEEETEEEPEEVEEEDAESEDKEEAEENDTEQEQEENE